MLEEVAEFGVLAPEALVERAEDAEFATRAMRSRIDPMKKVARMLRGHRESILNWVRAKKMFSSGVVEGHCKGRKLEGRLIYSNAIVDVPASKIDTDLKELFGKTVLAIGGLELAEKVPSWGECRYCDISKADCPERIETQADAVTEHGLF